MGDTTGIPIATPAVLVWSTPPFFTLSMTQVVEATILLASIAAESHAIFNMDMGRFGEFGHYPVALAIFPFTIWGALRFGVRGAVSVTLIIALVSILAATQGPGPLAMPPSLHSFIRWWVFATVIATTWLLLGVFSMERRRAVAALQQAREELKHRVEERTRDLSSSNRELRHEMARSWALEREVIRICEDQQRKLGQELHDGLGQQLTAVAFLAQALGERLRGQRPRLCDDAQEIERLERGHRHDTHAGPRAVSGRIGRERLGGALQQLAAQTHRVWGIECSFQQDSMACPTDPMAGINLYRIAQEAVNNAIKHGKARRIAIELSTAGETYRLSVSHDGAGFDPAASDSGEGLGLHIMRYRSNMIGASLDIRSTAGGDTTLTVVCP